MVHKNESTNPRDKNTNIPPQTIPTENTDIENKGEKSFQNNSAKDSSGQPHGKRFAPNTQANPIIAEEDVKESSLPKPQPAQAEQEFDTDQTPTPPTSPSTHAVASSSTSLSHSSEGNNVSDETRQAVKAPVEPENKTAEDKTYAVVIPLPRRVARVVRDLRQKYDPSIEYEPAHIPMVVGAISSDLERIKSVLRKVMTEATPINVTLDGAKSFAPLADVSYMPVSKGAKELGDLYQVLLNLPWIYDTTFEFDPHISLIRDQPENVQEKVVEEFKDTELNFSVDRLDLYEIGPFDYSGENSHVALHNWQKIEEYMFDH